MRMKSPDPFSTGSECGAALSALRVICQAQAKGQTTTAQGRTSTANVAVFGTLTCRVRAFSTTCLVLPFSSWKAVDEASGEWYSTSAAAEWSINTKIVTSAALLYAAADVRRLVYLAAGLNDVPSNGVSDAPV